MRITRLIDMLDLADHVAAHPLHLIQYLPIFFT